MPVEESQNTPRQIFPQDYALPGLTMVLVALAFFPFTLLRFPLEMSAPDILLAAVSFFCLFSGLKRYNRACMALWRERTLFTRVLNALCALLWPLSGLLLLGYGRREKRSGPVAAGCVSVFFLLLLCLMSRSVPGEWCLTGSVWALGTGWLLLPWRPGEERRKWALLILFVPATGWFLTEPWLIASLENETAQLRKQLSGTLGYSAEVKDFVARDHQGFPMDSEPFKSFLAASAKFLAAPDTAVLREDPVRILAAAQYKARVKLWRAKAPGMVKSAEKLASMAPRKLNHHCTENLYEMLMPELGLFRNSARYWRDLLRSEPENQAVRGQCNASLLRIRDWARQNEALISKQAAAGIELNRLNALTAVLAAGNCSPAEFRDLAGANVDWLREFMLCIGGEMTGMQWAAESALRGKMSETADMLPQYAAAVQKFFPLSFSLFLLWDYRYALRFYLKLPRLLTEKPLPHKKLEQLNTATAANLKNNKYRLSSCLLPLVPLLTRTACAATDMHTMVLAAAEVMNYQKTHGKLPASLDFLKEQPCSCYDGVPFKLERGELCAGGKGGEKFYGFRIGKSPVYSCKVILPRR